MRRTLVLFATSALLWELVAQCNHALSSAHVYLFVPALFVTYAALVLPLPAGLGSTVLAGLLCDANAPVPFGTHTLLFCLAHAAVSGLRDRLPHDHTVGRVVITVMLNFTLFLVFAFSQLGASPAPNAMWPRLLLDLACSQVFLALITPWFLALQHRALLLAGADRRVIA